MKKKISPKMIEKICLISVLVVCIVLIVIGITGQKRTYDNENIEENQVNDEYYEDYHTPNEYNTSGLGSQESTIDTEESTENQIETEEQTQETEVITES